MMHLKPASELIYSWQSLHQQLSAGISGPPISIDFIRHAESIANAKRLIAGRSEWALSTKWRIQALRLGLRLRDTYDYAWVSSLSRAHQTLSLARAVVGSRRVLSGSVSLPFGEFTDPRLDERSFGHLEGKARRPIEAYAAGDLGYAPPEGESYLELTRRVLSFLVDLRAEVRSPTRAIIVTHVGPLRLLAGILWQLHDPGEVLGLHFDNAKPVRILFTELRWPKFIDPSGVGCHARPRLGNTR